MTNKPIHFALAGLLHDIGKFGQRADITYLKSNDLKPQDKEIAGYLCKQPKDANYYTHLHVLWTKKFIESHISLFENAGLYQKDNTINNLVNLAAYHHKPASLEHSIVTMADHWSSGIDRNKSERKIKINEQFNFRTQPMVSIFNEITTNQNSQGVNKTFAYSVNPLNIEDTIFPVEANNAKVEENYAQLWREFNEAVSELKTTEPHALIYSIYHLLKKYTWYIPAATNDYPNCSLFEHSKITGAIAHCIAAYATAKPEAYSYDAATGLKLKQGNYPILMVCGDISGIQKFIYSISNKAAMKSLKGRSFYVQLLAETLCDELLKTCSATIVNQVYAAGGKFYALLPNTPEIIKTIENYQNAIQEKLWNSYNGKITLNIGYISFAMQQDAKEFGLEVVTAETEDAISVGSLWKMLADKTSERKKTRYNNLVINNFNNLFQPNGQGGSAPICSVEGEEIIGKPKDLDKKYVEQGEIQNEGVLVSAKVYEQIEIGEQLYNANYLIQTEKKGINSFDIGLNTTYQLIASNQITHTISKWINIQFATTPQMPLKTLENITGVGFKYYGGIPMAHNSNGVFTLQDICKLDISDSSNTAATTKLGILRMDVDNLGQLFMNGFTKTNVDGSINKSNASFSKLATLSALLEQYFSGYINTIRNNNIYFKNHINIVYSGGDDVFAVGRWDKLIEFALEVRNKFTQFVCGRSDITLSAGLAIVGAKFPIAKAAELAGDAEKAAKNTIINGQQKDAFAIFDIVIQWQEMEAVMELKQNLMVMLEGKVISNGLLMKLFSYYTIYNNNKTLTDAQSPNLSWKWQATYNLARAAKEAKNEQAKEAINQIKIILFTNKYKNYHMRFEALIVACRWAELELKIKNNLNK